MRSLGALRATNLLSGMRAGTVKVYDCVPINEEWSAQQIVTELHRQGPQSPFASVERSLRDLVDVGLVAVSGRKNAEKYQRVPVKRQQPTEETDVADEAKEDQEETSAGTLGMRMLELAENLRGLADEAESLATELETELSRGGDADRKLGALRDLLKDI